MSKPPPGAKSPAKTLRTLPTWLSSSAPPSSRRLERARLPAAQRALTILAGLLLLIVVGTLVLWMPISSTHLHGLAFNQALFTTVSAVTGTGLSIITPATDLSLKSADEAERLAGDLGELVRLREAAAAERRALSAERDRLEGERTRLALHHGLQHGRPAGR